MIKTYFIPTNQVKLYNLLDGEETMYFADITFEIIKSQHPKYKHAIWTSQGLKVSTGCFNEKGGCYGCAV